jgi:hypothetical protein
MVLRARPELEKPRFDNVPKIEWDGFGEERALELEMVEKAAA